ncbi:MAG: hypothetical protein MJE77_09695, partial [Proteobacteria bacterium]|nr:hypothetical protein [Pseudomonadota bacterium]
FLNHLAVRQAHVHPGSALRALSWLLAHAGTPVDRTVKKRRICAAVYNAACAGEAPQCTSADYLG